MINNILPLIFPLLSFHLLVEAQSSTIAVGPPLTCDITTFTCPSVTNGCCNIAGCCGTGCCALGYTCINEGTADQACCPNTDPTKCGTVSSPPPPDTPDTNGEPKTCTQIHNCRDISTGQTWTCLLGQTCTLYYRGCNPCPYIDSIGTGGGDDSGGSSDSPSPATTTSFDSTDTATDTATGAPAATTKASEGSLSEGSSWVMPLIVMGIFCLV
ncbi:hypothetical protein V8F33_000607, partial [Rhypophila sp. PSN 637]